MPLANVTAVQLENGTPHGYPPPKTGTGGQPLGPAAATRLVSAPSGPFGRRPMRGRVPITIPTSRTGNLDLW